LRRCAVTILLGDDARSPLEFHLRGRFGCRGGGLALVPVRLCPTYFQALNERKSDDSQFQAAAHSNQTLVAIDHNAFLRRHCSGRRVGSRWLDCISTIGILVFMTDDRLIAAHLTAALIVQAQDAKAKGSPVGSAAKLYFDVLDALRAESKNRHAGKPPSGAYQTIR
jgi:hypothetical protein